MSSYHLMHCILLIARKESECLVAMCLFVLWVCEMVFIKHARGCFLFRWAPRAACQKRRSFGICLCCRYLLQDPERERGFLRRRAKEGKRWRVEEPVWYDSRDNQLSSFPALFLFAVFFPTLCALLFGDLSMFIQF